MLDVKFMFFSENDLDTDGLTTGYLPGVVYDGTTLKILLKKYK